MKLEAKSRLSSETSEVTAGPALTGSPVSVLKKYAKTAPPKKAAEALELVSKLESAYSEVEKAEAAVKKANNTWKKLVSQVINFTAWQPNGKLP